MRLDSFTVFLDEIYQDSLEVVDSVSGNSCIVPFTVNEQLNCTFSCNDLTFIRPASDFEPLFFELSDVMDTVCFGEYQISGASIQAGPILNGVQTYALPPTINTPAEVTISNTTSGQSCTFQLNIVDFPSAIKGQVFIDEDGMCDWDTLTEVTSLSNILIRVVEPVLEDTFYTVTDFDGKYQINLPFGDYEIEALSPDDARWSMCGATFISIGQDTILEGVNHVLKPEEFCYYPEVNVSGSFLRRCFDRVISVRYANNGSILMPDATVEIMLPADLSITDASMPFTDEGSNRYVFEVGDLDPGENGVIFLTLYTACNDDVILGENLCIEARMLPLSDCDVVDNYSGANLDVKGSCIGDSVVFEIENLGPGDMLVPYEFIVIEDEILRTRQNVDLVAGQMEQLTYEANGAAFTIVTEQVVENPFSRQISSFVETCTSSSSQLISLGFGNMFPQTDEEPNLSIECLEVRGSFDPNDKNGTPTGISDTRNIAEGLGIEYTIRFENVGNDTAFTVRIEDQLDTNFDLSTLRLLGASHEVELSTTGNQLTFLISNANLPPLSVDSIGAQGFVTFEIFPLPGLEKFTQLFNEASIFFDFNAPIITNQTLHTIGLDFMTTTKEVMRSGDLGVHPNPASEEIHITCDVGKLFEQISILGINGVVHSTQFNDDTVSIGHLLPGVYLVRAIAGGEIYIGRFIKVDNQN